MGSDLSMASRVELTKKYAVAYSGASKKEKAQILDMLCEVTGWNRDHARHQLRARLEQPPGRARATVAVIDRRKQRPRKYSYDALLVLQRVWAISGGECGKYLAVAMEDLLDSLEAHGRLVVGQRRYSVQVRAELLEMSPATIDRYLAPARAKDPLHGISATKPGTLLRNSITIRKAGDEVEAEPGFFEGDTVAHCGPTLKGEFVRSLNLTDMRTGWVFTFSIRNNARVHMLDALGRAFTAIPFLVSGLDFDNGSEFINHDVVNWAAGKDVFFTRGRPYKKNDQATIESKNNHLVRHYAFHYRYDTRVELRILNELWPLVNDRLNFFSPTKKPISWSTDRAGRRKRVYDTQKTPYRRLLTSGILSRPQERELAQYKASLDPAGIAEDIDRLQQQLIALAAEKTRRLEIETETAKRKRLPDPAGIKIRLAAS